MADESTPTQRPHDPTFLSRKPDVGAEAFFAIDLLTPSTASSCATPNVDSGLGRTPRDVRKPAWPGSHPDTGSSVQSLSDPHQRYSSRPAGAQPRP